MSIPKSQKRARGERISLSDAINGTTSFNRRYRAGGRVCGLSLNPDCPHISREPIAPIPGAERERFYRRTRHIAWWRASISQQQGSLSCYALTRGKNKGVIWKWHKDAILLIWFWRIIYFTKSNRVLSYFSLHLFFFYRFQKYIF